VDLISNLFVTLRKTSVGFLVEYQNERGVNRGGLDMMALPLKKLEQYGDPNAVMRIHLECGEGERDIPSKGTISIKLMLLDGMKECMDLTAFIYNFEKNGEGEFTEDMDFGATSVILHYRSHLDAGILISELLSIHTEFNVARVVRAMASVFISSLTPIETGMEDMTLRDEVIEDEELKERSSRRRK
jgi:hypothetical protein